MAKKKGALEQIADAVGDAVQAVAVEVGLTTEDAPKARRPKISRKAAQKKVIARVEQEQQESKVARRSTRPHTQ